LRKANFYTYTIYEDGTIINQHGREIKKRLHNGRYEVKLKVGDKRKNYVVPRLIYYVFNPFDITDKNLCISFKDNNKQNIHLDNLYLTHRKNLIQGEKHKSIATLTNEQAEQIRKEYKGKAGNNQYNKNSLSLNDLAKKYNTTKANIKMIIHGSSRNEKDYKLK
jgi:hypothetical protein